MALPIVGEPAKGRRAVKKDRAFLRKVVARSSSGGAAELLKTSPQTETNLPKCRSLPAPRRPLATSRYGNFAPNTVFPLFHSERPAICTFDALSYEASTISPLFHFSLDKRVEPLHSAHLGFLSTVLPSAIESLRESVPVVRYASFRKIDRTEHARGKLARQMRLFEILIDGSQTLAVKRKYML